MKFFEVVAKCGHVGRGYYYEGHFFVRAQDEKHASAIVKTKGRVKKDHEDVILRVGEVDELTYLAGVEAFRNNPYFFCKSKHEQNLYTEEILKGVRPETDRQIKYRERRTKNSGRRNENTDKPKKYRGIRNPYKYFKYNPEVSYAGW